MRRRIRPLVLLKKQPSWGLGQRVNSAFRFMTGGGRLQGINIFNAATTDLVGTIQPTSITFELTGCLYVTGSNTNSLIQTFTFYLNGTSISTGTPISNPLTNNPLAQKWTIQFAANAILNAGLVSDAGRTEDFWIDGDVLTMELTPGFASLLQVRPDCIFANINVNDQLAKAINVLPVTNLYNIPSSWLSESQGNWLSEIGDVWDPENSVLIKIPDAVEMLSVNASGSELMMVAIRGDGSPDRFMSLNELQSYVKS